MQVICANDKKYDIIIFPFYHFTACPKAEILNSVIVKSYLGERVELLEIPAHTDDSIAILLDHSIAIVGDTMVNIFGNRYPPFADNEEVIKASWKALLDMQCKLFCPSHGNPLGRAELFSAYQKACRF